MGITNAACHTQICIEFRWSESGTTGVEEEAIHIEEEHWLFPIRTKLGFPTIDIPLKIEHSN